MTKPDFNSPTPGKIKSKNHEPASRQMPSAEDVVVAYVEMEAFNNPANGKQGFILSHGLNGVGFGEFVFVRHPDGRYTVDNETMGRPWVRRVLNAFLDKCELRDEV